MRFQQVGRQFDAVLIAFIGCRLERLRPLGMIPQKGGHIGDGIEIGHARCIAGHAEPDQRSGPFADFLGPGIRRAGDRFLIRLPMDVSQFQVMISLTRQGLQPVALRIVGRRAKHLHIARHIVRTTDVDNGPVKTVAEAGHKVRRLLTQKR